MYAKYFKRIFDLVISILALPIFIFIFIVLAIFIKLEDGGSVIYISKRIGKNFKIFNMYKFRSMKVDAPNILNDDGSTYNSKNDHRVTKVGRFIRETSIDETAQIINVMIGNMSLIGPRPGDVESINTYRDDEKDKTLVKPGITGYSQAYYRNNLGVRKKRLNDVWYAHNVNFVLDVKIFIKTIFVLLKRNGVYTNDCEKETNS